jgi:hypothetical protein
MYHLKVESVKLLVALLLKEGGNVEVQETVHNHFVNSDTSPFFFEVILLYYHSHCLCLFKVIRQFAQRYHLNLLPGQAFFCKAD